MECKVRIHPVSVDPMKSIDLTRMECKGSNNDKYKGWKICIDLTRMECKVKKKHRLKLLWSV